MIYSTSDRMSTTNILGDVSYIYVRINVLSGSKWDPPRVRHFGDFHLFAFYGVNELRIKKKRENPSSPYSTTIYF